MSIITKFLLHMIGNREAIELYEKKLKTEKEIANKGLERYILENYGKQEQGKQFAGSRA